MAAVSLDRLVKRFPRAGLVVRDLSAEVEEGEFFTLLGPSGCGKSTTLRMIAGFEEPTSGRIRFGDRDVTFLAASERGVGLVFQNYALFPHMSVGQNVAFGLEVRRVQRSQIRRRVAETLEQVKLAGLENARVDQLSGGQQQRVALARALVIKPTLLLLDEPLSNLDAKLRIETRAALRALHAETGVTTIYVTHDQSEAMAMSDRVAVMQDGYLHQVGAPVEVYERPATRFVASFLGRCNILDGFVAAVSNGQVSIRFQEGSTLSARVERRSPDLAIETGSKVGFCIRAESVALLNEASGRQNTVAGTVEDLDYTGAQVQCRVSTPLGQIHLETSGAGVHPQRGERVCLELPQERAFLVSAT